MTARAQGRGLGTALLALLLGAAGLGAQAETLGIGGLTLDSQGFADVLLAASGSYATNAATLADAVTDHSLATWAQTASAGASLVLGFTDNRVVNGPGDDLALFEVGHEAYEYSQEGFDSFWVTINGVSRLYFTTETTTLVNDHNVNMTRLDLSHFGLADGASIDRVQIGMDYDTRGSTPQLQLVAAIHSVAAPVPEPTPGALLLAGCGALALRSRRARRHGGGHGGGDRP